MTVGIRILSEGARQEMHRRDYAAAANRYRRIVALQHPDDASARFEALRAKREEAYIVGRDRGQNSELELAIALARQYVAEAPDADRRRAAQNDLGLALAALGERERGTGRLEEAVAAFKAALED